MVMTTVKGALLIAAATALLAGPASAQGALTGLTGGMADQGTSHAAAQGGLPKSQPTPSVPMPDSNRFVTRPAPNDVTPARGKRTDSDTTGALPEPDAPANPQPIR